MILVHVDISFNGFLRKWHLERFASGKDQLISWRYVQPLSVEDHTKDIVTLSVAREQAMELPSEDLADALEVLSGDEQQAWEHNDLLLATPVCAMLSFLSQVPGAPEHNRYPNGTCC